MNCPLCGHPRLQPVEVILAARDAENAEVLITGVPANRCCDCEEQMYDPAVEDRVAEVVTQPVVGKDRVLPYGDH